MTKERAVELLQAFHDSIGEANAILKRDHILYASKSGAALIAFNYDPDKRALICRGEIYVFDRAPKPGIIEALFEEERSGTTTGGGQLEYLARNRGLYLRRTFDKSVDQRVFTDEMLELGEASLRWRREVLEDVFDRVNNKVRREKGASPR